MSRIIKYAPDAWKLLNGVFGVYKYANIDSHQLKKRIINTLVRDLNALKGRPPRKLVKIEGPVGAGELTVATVPSYSDNALVVGPRYQGQDFSLGWATDHGPLTTGLAVLGIGRQASIVQLLKGNNLLRSYEIEAKFGFVTDDLTENGKILEKTSFKHMTENKLDKILGATQAEHQAVAFKYAGVRLDSQKAYELASKGLVRPAENSQFLLYGIKCIRFQPPEFTLRVQCINENEDYLKELVHTIGSRSKCWASTSKIRMTRFGPFTLEHALLRKHWTLQHIIDNIEYCSSLFDQQYTKPDSQHLQSLVL